MRRWHWVPLALMAACAPLAEKHVDPVAEPVVEPIIAVEPALQRSDTCPEEPDDGIGGTGCTPELE